LLTANLSYRAFHLFGYEKILMPRHPPIVGVKYLAPIARKNCSSAPLEIIKKRFGAEFNNPASGHAKAPSDVV